MVLPQEQSKHVHRGSVARPPISSVHTSHVPLLSPRLLWRTWTAWQRNASLFSHTSPSPSRASIGWRITETTCKCNEIVADTNRNMEDSFEN
ncbi:hypothetical protein BaRGS_00015137 [Batillaria attramentaria]|uniref:Uncharacterized protein n=1 Tax=Batillaria attramentaria TaxID=370345 RepID=A0ABD0L2D5_9CAEN